VTDLKERLNSPTVHRSHDFWMRRDFFDSVVRVDKPANAAIAQLADLLCNSHLGGQDTGLQVAHHLQHDVIELRTSDSGTTQTVKPVVMFHNLCAWHRLCCKFIVAAVEHLGHTETSIQPRTPEYLW
jgi:hypothetical protein